jgi:hypothetical protein
MRTRVSRKRAVGTVVVALSTALLWCSELSATQLYGTVRQGGKPAANVSIQVQGGPQVITDSAGGYVLNVPPGNYVLKVQGHEISVQVPTQDTRKDLDLSNP